MPRGQDRYEKQSANQYGMRAGNFVANAAFLEKGKLQWVLLEPDLCKNLAVQGTPEIASGSDEDGEMKRIERENQKPGTVTYELDDGRYVTLEESAVVQFGADNLVEWLGLKRFPVMQHGRRVGTLPADFDPLNARSRNPTFSVRPGDLKREGDAWVAEDLLSSYELDAFVEFERDKDK